MQAKEPIGWLAYDSFTAAEATVEEAMDRISVSNLVSADTPLMETAKLYSEQSPWIFIVLKRNQPLGWISYHSLLGPPFRACLFGLILAIEQAMAELLKAYAKFAVSKLPEKRVEAARRVYSLRGYAKWHGKDASDNALIDCSNFIDKVTVIESCPSTLAALPSFNRSALVRAEAIRNALAHPTPESELVTLLPKQDLHNFVGWLTSLEAELASRLRSEDRFA
ncbi:MAG: hypothetical protein L0Z50_10630 [Verrucomicrobiales bacterium]|nr:hypothetical protein [Verrucomicrobiales bacterium]